MLKRPERILSIIEELTDQYQEDNRYNLPIPRIVFYLSEILSNFANRSFI
jgi:hypothetical protein